MNALGEVLLQNQKITDLEENFELSKSKAHDVFSIALNTDMVHCTLDMKEIPLIYVFQKYRILASCFSS